MAAKSVSCGVIITDGERLVLGHATRSPRWDIPKGIAEPGESLIAAARRELFEETGLDAPEAELKPLGVAPYRAGKDLALFAWAVPVLPDPERLHCASCFDWRGNMLPEFDRFGVFTHAEALAKVGKAMASRLAGISLKSLCEASS
jgi:8-oxo-dGTP pyrophosphatase MutT (NUDIX family)